MNTPEELLEAFGRNHWGNDWIERTANELGVASKLLLNITRGKSYLKWDSQIIESIKGILDDEIATLQRIRAMAGE